MKKRGITLTEILVAVTIFSLGIVPLILSLGSSFEATVFNRDYTKAMEYNLQMMDEIGALMPTKVGMSQYSGLVGSSSLEEDVRRVLNARSEDTPADKGIYQVVDLKVDNFDFTSGELVDRKMYRKISVRDAIGDHEAELVILPVDIEARYVKSDDLIVKSFMLINLDRSEDDVVGGDIIGGDDIHVKKGDEERVPEDGYLGTNHNELARHIKLFIVGRGSGANSHKVEAARLGIFRHGYETIYDLNREQTDLFSRNIDIEVGDEISFYLSTTGGTAVVAKLEYKLYRNKK